MSYANNSNNISKTSNNNINITQDNKISYSFKGQNNNNAYPDSDICNALDCFEKATMCIKINAGKFGDISLRVCSNCVSKFKTSSIAQK